MDYGILPVVERTKSIWLTSSKKKASFVSGIHVHCAIAIFVTSHYFVTKVGLQKRHVLDLAGPKADQHFSRRLAQLMALSIL